MPSGRWLLVKEVLAAALEEPPGGRTALVDRLCAGDSELRQEVESLLQADASAGSLFEQPLLNAIEPAAPDPHVGRAVGQYIVESCLGHGGMGAVYLARRADDAFERRVAIKMIRRGMDSDQVVRRFRHERQILASLEHPNIAALYDGGTGPDGLPYFVMEYVAGTRIDWYADQQRLPTPERIRLCLPIFDAVQHAHDRHIVHRDIKPTNVMVTADGHPKLLDFGIAKILDTPVDGPSTFTAMGRPMTPDYASPEQIRGTPVTAATDVYALGLLLYELVTGCRPFRLVSYTPDEIARVICDQDPEAPSTVTGRNGRLDDILLKALRKEPDERYLSVAAFAEDLRRHISSEPVAIAWDSRRYRAARLLRRHRTTLTVAALLVLAIGVTARLTSISAPRAASGPADTPGVAAAASASRPSVAVLEFRNVSASPDDQWIATAIPEMLTTELAGDGQLRVLPAERVVRAMVDRRQNAAGGLSQEAVDDLRRALASDFVLFGHYMISERAAPQSLRIDVRMQRAGADPISVSATGDEGQLFALISQIGRQLRAQLGLRESPAEVTRHVRAAFPHTTEATRLYAEGIDRLRVLDAVAARDLLERAASSEPGNPLIQTALAAAWTALGYDVRAASAARKALEASAELGREQRLNVEGRAHVAEKQWPHAVDVYRRLWGFFSDNIEYGLQLAAAQTAAGQPTEALKTVEAVRRLPAPQSDDPRIDLEHSQASSVLGDFKSELQSVQRALARATESGTRHLIARARLFEGRSYFNQGQLTQAEKSLVVARQAFVEIGDRAGVASAENSLASVISDLRDLPRAEAIYQQALSTSEQIGDRRLMSAVLNNLSVVQKDQRRFDDARRVQERALALRREIDDRNSIASSLNNIGVVLFEQDRFRDAIKYYEESLAIAREIGDRRQQVRALHNRAVIDRELGHLAAARAGYEASLATRADIGDKRGLVMGRVELGAVLLAQGELDRAQKTIDEAALGARELA